MSSTNPRLAPLATSDKFDPLLRRYGIQPTDDSRTTLAGYSARTHRSRWWGVVGAMIAGSIGLLGSSGDSLGLGVARIFAGYLLGSAVAELLSPERRARGAIHTASLTTRLPKLLMPSWAQVLPWLFLVPCLASPLLLLGVHPTGVTRVRDHNGSGMSTASWFSSSALITTAVTAAAALVLWRLTMRRVSRRRLPVDSPDAARLDLLTRALSARAVSGAAAALGLSLLSGLAFLASEPAMSMACTTSTDCHYLYTWHAKSDLLQNLGALFLLAALLLFWFSRRQTVDQSLLEPAENSPR